VWRNLRDNDDMNLSPRLVGDLRVLSCELARGAADIALRRRDGGVRVAATKTSDTDIVTAADREVEEWLRDRLRVARPGDGVLGEEGDDAVGSSGLTWIIDPIDGTVNYLYGLPFWAVSVAVCAGPPRPGSWSLLAGAVCAPVLGATWHAARGHGAFREDRRLPSRAGADLRHALVATGFGYTVEQRVRQGEVVGAVLPRVRDIRRLGCASVDLCLVADGTLDAYYESGLHAWDMAAGCLIVEEAGGRVHGLRGRPASREMVVAGHGGTAQALADLLAALPTAG